METAPFLLNHPLLSLAIGFSFGFVLESCGFGDSRRMAAQFYLTDMRVLKVMFTAIVTCMLLLVWVWSFGWLDEQALAINPTNLWPGILGGILLGFGFVIGGYCPGTSIVSSSTGKLDGMFFLGGVTVGVWIFGETGVHFRTFYDTAGDLGRFTLPELLGLSPGVVAILVTLMALAMFWAGEKVEKIFGPKDREEPAPKLPRLLLKPAARAAAVTLLLMATLAVSSSAIGRPLVLTRLDHISGELDQTLASRSVHIDPVELLGLMHGYVDGAPGRVQLALIDVRDEAEFNRFHLVDAKRTTLDDLQGGAGERYAGDHYDVAIKVVLGDGEARAEQGYRLLRAHGANDVYVLAGGINQWLDVFRDGKVEARPRPDDEAPRHEFDQALGSRDPAARPTLRQYEALADGVERPFEFKVQPVVAAPEPSAGCG
ncbi:MAG: YeeE/YedE thiosulfate transporter family protein [Holophagae bacterium]|jgi:rhodanese-related sulfurtransferase